MAIRFPWANCKRSGGQSATDTRREPVRIIEGANLETQSRILAISAQSPRQLSKFVQALEGIKDGLVTPEALKRTYSEFGAVFDMLVPRIQQYKRFQKKWHHELLDDAIKAGIVEGSHESAMIHLMLANVRSDLLFGSKKLTLPELRKRMRQFVNGEIDDYGKLLMRNKKLAAGPKDVQAYQELIRRVEGGLTDRHLKFAQRFSESMWQAREKGKEEMRKYWKGLGKAEKDIPGLELETFVPDLDAYAPLVRYQMRQVMGAPEAGKIVPELQGIFQHEMKMMDGLFGLDDLDGVYGGAITELGQAMRDHAGIAKDDPFKAFKKFEFSDPDALGLDPRTYTSEGKDGLSAFQMALSDLFDIALPAASPNGVILKKGIDKHTVNLLSQAQQAVFAATRNRNASLIASMAHIPEEISVRFYKKRMLSVNPINADITQSFQSYMNATSKFAHVEPMLAGVSDIVKKIPRGDDWKRQLIIQYVNDTIGNPATANRASMDAMGTLAGWSYNATLVGNVSPAIANYLGQVGFSVAEQGFIPTMVAIKALSSRSGKYSPMHDMLKLNGIGLESRPSGRETVGEAFAEMRAATTIGERVRRAIDLGLSSIDIFATSERHMHQVTYLAGIVRHMQDRGVWKPGMGQDGLAKAWKSYTKSNVDDMVLSGEWGIAKGAFLFGNINNPRFLRWVRSSDPLGAGQAATMFSNYPIQAFARLSMWTHDMSRFITHGPGDKTAKEGAAKLFRFFTYGTAVAGPFFLALPLRDMVSSGDEGTASKLKDLFVEWERKYSFAGLIMQVNSMMGGEGPMQGGEFGGAGANRTFDTQGETIDLAAKLSVMPTLYEPLGPLGNLFGGPVIQLADSITKATGLQPGTTKASRSSARESLLGGYIENKISGLGNEGRPFPTATATVIPAGVAAARILNSAATLMQGEQVDGQGRLIRPTNFSREVLRQFGRPLGEVIAASEGKVSEREIDHREFDERRLKKGIIEGNAALVGDMLVKNPDLINTVSNKAMHRVLRDSRLVPRARAAARSRRSHARQTLRRVARRLGEGNMSPAEEFEAVQIYAILMLRAKSKTGL